MKIRYYLITCAVILVFSITFGLFNQRTYTDLNKDENAINDFVVGIFPEEMVDGVIEKYENGLDTQNYILAVKCTGEIYYKFESAIQSVVVEKVFTGDGIDVNDEINVVCATGLTSTEDIQINGKDQLDLDFTNVMIPDKTYLVFLDRKIKTRDNVYMYDKASFFIKPYFCYDTIDNVILTSEDDIASVASYTVASNNEFFLETEESIKKLTDYKNMLLNKYQR